MEEPPAPSGGPRQGSDRPEGRHERRGEGRRQRQEEDATAGALLVGGEEEDFS